MKKRDDFCECFGEPDQAFIDRIHVTLSALPQEKEVKVKKVYRTVALVAALLALMTLALAETNFLGFQDIMKMWFGGNVDFEEEAIGIAQRDIALTGAEMAMAEVRVCEVLYDGSNLIVVTQLTPKDDKTLFINMFDSELGCPMQIMGENGEIVQTGLTVEEYAEKYGYEHIVCASASVTIPDKSNSAGEKVNILGGVLDMELFSGLNGAETIPVTMNIALWDMAAENARQGGLERAQVEFEIHKTEVRGETLQNTFGVSCPSLGLRVDSVTVQRTVLGAYAVAEWSVEEEKTYQNAVKKGVWVDFLDASGVPYQCMMVEREKISDGRYREMMTIPQLKGDLTSITLRIYDNDEASETISVPLTLIK